MCVVRALFALTVPLLLSACAARDPIVSTAGATPVGNWRVERQVDRVTGAPLSSALLRTASSSNSAVAYPEPALLQLMCFKNEPTVRLNFAFKVGSNKNSVLGYRFDEKPGREIEARFLADFKTVVIEDSAEVEQFLGELATSKLLYLRIQSLNAGRTSAEFRLDGAPTAIEAALAQCRSAGDAPRRRA
jgi:hypothetical protein